MLWCPACGSGLVLGVQRLAARAEVVDYVKTLFFSLSSFVPLSVWGVLSSFEKQKKQLGAVPMGNKK